MSLTTETPAERVNVVPFGRRLLGHRTLLIVGFLFLTMSFIRANVDGAAKLSASFTVFTTLEFTVPILLAGLAGLWAERVGVVNIGIEGMMILGTWFGAVGAWKWGPWVGLLLAIIGGCLGGLLHAVATVTFNVNHIISGVAINLLAFGAMRFISELWWGPGADNVPQGAGITQSPQQSSALPRFDFAFLSGGHIGSWKSPDMLGWLERRGWPVIGDLASILRGFTWHVSAGTLIALVLVPLTAWVLWRTRFGLRVRSSGESPEAAESLGVRVTSLRYRGLMISGAFAGLGGGYLSIVASSYYRQGQTANKGFIGLATMIGGNWRPVGVLASSFLFGFPEALNRVGRAALPHLFLFGAIVCIAWGLLSLYRRRWIAFGVSVPLTVLLFVMWNRIDEIPESLTTGVPYLLTLIVLAMASARLRPPAHAGLPYKPGEGH
ncbi:MAG TPA: ABC transporter permease [Ilumatobacteraceae bacterium]|nr:ABC transporter permease [Ilumatobacteraceae bacterium]